jgi:TolB-like protein/Tfp pilus assembly protein PilF
MAVLALVVAIGGYGLYQALDVRGGAGAIDSVVVLPLKNLMHDPEQDYFVDGMTEALITELAKIGTLRVISRTTAMKYKGTDKSVPEIGQELDVRGVVEGSVLRSGDRVRITAQLIHAPSDTHLWAESYDRDLGDILALHSEVARTIAQKVKVTLTPDEETRLVIARPVIPEAHEAYLKGRYYSAKSTEDGFRKAIEYFEQAYDKDPNYAPAYVGLAWSYIVLGEVIDVLPHGQAHTKAQSAVMKALEIDDTLAEAHAVLGWVRLLYDWNWLAAGEEFKRAIALNVNSVSGHEGYAFYLSIMGQREEAIAALQKAVAISGKNPYQLATLGHAYAAAGKRAEAMQVLDELMELSKRKHVAPTAIAVVYVGLGEKEQAFAWLDMAYKSRHIHVTYLTLEPMYDSLRSDPRFQDLVRRLNFPE